MNKNLTNLWNLSKAQSQPAPETSNVQETVQENENADAAASTTTVDQETKVKKRSKSSLSGSSKRVRSMLVDLSYFHLQTQPELTPIFF